MARITKYISSFDLGDFYLGVPVYYPQEWEIDYDSKYEFANTHNVQDFKHRFIKFLVDTGIYSALKQTIQQCITYSKVDTTFRSEEHTSELQSH